MKTTFRIKLVSLLPMLMTFNLIVYSQQSDTLISKSNLDYNKMDTSIVKLFSDSIPITVFVYFMVDKNGEIKNVKVKKVECKKCDKTTKEHFIKEAERVILSSPKWEPRQDSKGNPREVSFLLPVKFMIKNE
ncbi:MAG: hypothetical protein SNJ64_03140 [Endomicrobiia bacterium]